MNKKGTILILFVALSGLQCNRRDVPAPIHHDDAPSESPPTKGIVHFADASSELVGIKLQKVKSQEGRSVLNATGMFSAPQPQQAVISHAHPARVGEIHVKIGDWVKKGQPLVTLECHEVGNAKSECCMALTDLELAELNLAREERLLKHGVGIKKNFAAAEAAHKIAEVTAEAAHAKLHVLGFSEEQVKDIAETHPINPTITLSAPIPGKVVSNKAVLGALFDELSEILTIIDPKLLWVEAQIQEKDIAKVKVGQDVEIAVPAYPGDVFRGKLSYIGDLVDEQTGTITVRADVKNDDFRLKPGMSADIEILLDGGQ